MECVSHAKCVFERQIPERRKKLYSDLEAPITLVYGKHDWSSLRERSETRALLSSQNYIELEDVVHFSFLELPEKAVSIIKSYG